jgi:hypothetical protein
VVVSVQGSVRLLIAGGLLLRAQHAEQKFAAAMLGRVSQIVCLPQRMVHGTGPEVT